MIQKATLADSKKIQQLINSCAKQGKVIERSLNYIYSNIRDFWVYLENGQIVGCCALSIVGWQSLAEIKSLVVIKKNQRKGVGAKLVKRCIKEAGDLAVKEVFALTFMPEFFQKLGFKEIDLNKLPHKIWNDCLNCLSFPNCLESAVILKVK